MTMIVQPSQRGVEIDHQLPLDALLRLDAGTYARKRLRRPHSYDVLRRLDAACAARGSRRILRAIDAQGRTHATLYLAWDERTVYALLSALDPALRVSGANTLLY